jgi:hypothetical protein
MATNKKAYCVFVDFTKCFDRVNRSIAVEACAAAGVRGPILNLIISCLGRGSIRVYNGAHVSNPIHQETGLAQGDNISPILLVAILTKMAKEFEERFPDVKLTIYADDVAMVARDINLLREALKFFEELCRKYELEINPSKTKWMRFVKAGRMGNFGEIRMAGSVLERVVRFEYLGVTVTPSLESFRVHLETRAAKAVAASFSIASPYLLSLKCALELYSMSVEPVLCYGLEVVWKSLTARQMSVLDSVKARFLKRVMGVSKYTRNRLMFIICQCPTGAEAARERMQLEFTRQYEEYQDTQFGKLTEIDEDIFGEPLTLLDAHLMPLAKSRHVMARLAVHGFHANFCTRESFHYAEEMCVCRLCGLHCSQYHSLSCALNTQSIYDMAG